MSRPGVYVESTVISYYTARPSRDLVAAAHQELTVEWWDNALPNFDPFISQFVLDEIGKGDPEASAKRINVCEPFMILEMNADVQMLAEKYHASLDIPEKARTDAFHVAIAVLHGMEYLVTWNCTHIASGRVRSMIDSINAELGYATPVICTPEELMEA